MKMLKKLLLNQCLHFLKWSIQHFYLQFILTLYFDQSLSTVYRILSVSLAVVFLSLLTNAPPLCHSGWTHCNSVTQNPF